MWLGILLPLCVVSYWLWGSQRQWRCRPTFLELMVGSGEVLWTQQSSILFLLCSVHAFVCVTLRMEPRASCVPGKCSATELHPHSHASHVRSSAACTECQRVMVQMACVFRGQLSWFWRKLPPGVCLIHEVFKIRGRHCLARRTHAAMVVLSVFVIDDHNRRMLTRAHFLCQTNHESRRRPQEKDEQCERKLEMNSVTHDFHTST